MNAASVPADRAQAGLALLTGRRSVSPKRLGEPAPDAAAIERMLAAALRAPDHGRLLPWRVIEFPRAGRAALAALFAAEKLRRAPDSDADDLARAEDHAHRAPALLAFVVRIRPETQVPSHEQWLAAGAALGNLLNAAHAQGYGAIMLSGDRCGDPALRAALGLAPGETLAGFVSIGSILAPPPPAEPVATGRVRSVWPPAH